jgi:anti-sigma B factor antagonist
MTIQQRLVGDVTVLDVGGRMSASSPERLLAVTVRRLLQSDQKRILVNMQEVPYIDSTGLAEIVGAYHAATRRGGTFKLVHLTPHVRELLTVTMLLTVFEVFESEADALASFGVVSS